MTIYYTVNNEYTMIDSISYDFEALKKKFPDKEIFITDELESIYDITREEINLEPKDFLHCATIEELTDEVEDTVYNKTSHPTHPGFEISEEIGTRFWDSTYSFYNKWQELKGLPQNL